MELKEVINNLTVKGDVCLLNSSDLIEKYCKDEYTYSNFLEVFSKAFSRRKMYPLLVSFKYRDIEEVISNGQKYSSNENEAYESDILREIYKNEHQSYLDIRGDDHGQAISLFNESIGAYKVKNDVSSCGEKMLRMSECASIYSLSDGNISENEFVEFLDVLYSSDELALYPHRIDTILKNYYAKNPKMKLCYNNDFLYLVNYLIHSHTECCDDEFIKFAKNVISISTSLDSAVPTDFSKTDYMKLAKFTLQNIDKLEKKRNELVKPKRKFLNFLKK